jgi:hypothetical protein
MVHGLGVLSDLLNELCVLFTVLTVAKVDSVRELYLRKSRAITDRNGNANATLGHTYPMVGTGRKLWSEAYEAGTRGDDDHRASEMRFN